MDFLYKQLVAISEDMRVKGLRQYSGILDIYLKQYIYRYIALFERWNGTRWKENTEDDRKASIAYITDKCYDGKIHKSENEYLLKFHQAGKPRKLAVRWHIGKAEYAAYFWFGEEGIRTTFERFYGIHPDTKADFLIRIDSVNNKYELALYRYGLREPQVISEDTYQMIVFKNKFECYRSENYDQPRGAWTW